MMSVQSSGVFHILRLVRWFMRDLESLCTRDNEIWLEKLHFDSLADWKFSLEFEGCPRRIRKSLLPSVLSDGGHNS